VYSFFGKGGFTSYFSYGRLFIFTAAAKRGDGGIKKEIGALKPRMNRLSHTKSHRSLPPGL
jgi:hypothetical protein